MHMSRLAGFIIDCKDTEPEVAAEFWRHALGMATRQAEEPNFKRLDTGVRDLHIEVQRVRHDSRVHLDIETDDIEQEVARLEKLGARRIVNIKRWWVMEAPTGHRFCVVRADRDLKDAPGATVWP